MIKWINSKKNIDDLKPDPSNPRKIKGKKFQDLKDSLDKFGLAEPIVVNFDGTIIGGHARYLAYKEKGIEEIDCYVADRQLSEEESKELLIRLNKNTAGEWDFDMLANNFDIEDLQNWGFEDFELGFMKEQESMIDTDGLPSSLDSYLDGNIRQIVLMFGVQEFETTIAKLGNLQTKLGKDNNTDVFVELLRFYEENNA